MWFDDRSVTLPSAASGGAAGVSGASTSAAGPAHDADAAAAGSSGKKAEKKAAAKAAKEAKKAANAAKQAAQASSVDDNDPLKHRYGDAEMIQSKNISGKTWTTVRDLDLTKKDQEVLVRARVQAVRGKGKSAFLVLRSESFTVQAILFVDDVTVSKGMVKYASNIPKESMVDVAGFVRQPGEKVKSCTQQDVEIQVTGISTVSKTSTALPFELADAARSTKEVEEAKARGENLPTVLQDHRLNNRVLDLRTPANNAIFQIQSGVCMLFREILLSKGFREIHTPKLIAGASEGGSSVFKLQYMGNYPSLARPACLAQSPQVYKQMCICSDFDKVFEIGPVFRAEDSNTHRHLCEFTGLDIEMSIKEHYFEVLDVIGDMFNYIFEGLNKRFKKELDAVREQYPFEDIEFLPKALKLTFAEGIKMLHEAGYTHVDPYGDLNTETERVLGKLVKQKYKTDFFILHKYPLSVRPFYTMPCPEDDKLSNSFDVFIRGEEIISGAQRIHDPELLIQRGKELDVDPETVNLYAGEGGMLRFGAPPHGGCGVGLERVVMLFMGLNNIRKTSLFPRDPNRLTP
ncbi:aspartate--tRNA ligase [Pseudoscourfieldia marina]